MPGIPVVAPMTPNEYRAIWHHFLSHDDPMYVSEHRRSFSIDYEMQDSIGEADVTLFAISSTRLNALQAKKILEEQHIPCNIIHLLWLKPFIVEQRMLSALNLSRFGGLVIDGDFENGVLKHVAYDLMRSSKAEIEVLGLEDRVAGFAPELDNLPPSPDRIVAKVIDIINKKRA